MATDYDESEIRRYLLSDLADDTCASLEQEYFASQATFDRVWAAENDLIDGYLSGALSPDDRDRFERYYLATPGHRSRLAIARELRAAAVSKAAAPTRNETAWWTSAVRAALEWPPAWITAGAALLLLAVGGAWMIRSRSAVNPPTVGTQQPSGVRAPYQSQSEPARPSPVVVARSLSPVSVRGTDEGTTLTIAPGTDLIVLQLEGDPVPPAFGSERAVVRTVSGNEVWRGPAASERGVPSAAVARVEIPAGKLTPDDYIVVLFGADRHGREAERYRYFLRVRER